MNIKSSDERRKHRAQLTKQALAEIVRLRLFERRLHQTTVSRRSGVSRSHLRALLRAEKQMSLFIILELSEALGFEDPCQLLRGVLDRRDQLAGKDVEGPIADKSVPTIDGILIRTLSGHSRRLPDD